MTRDKLIKFHHAKGWWNCAHKSTERLQAEYDAIMRSRRNRADSQWSVDSVIARYELESDEMQTREQKARSLIMTGEA